MYDTRMSSRSFFFSCCALVVLVACGGGAESLPPRAPPGAEKSVTTTDPSTVEEAQDQIARAKAELGTGTKRFAEPPPAPPPPPPTTQPKTPSDAKAESSSTANADPCVSPCRAIASMRRAVGALCRLTGDEDTRCSEAKKTLADSETRIATCAC
jgi:hypothetical protein